MVSLRRCSLLLALHYKNCLIKVQAWSPFQVTSTFVSELHVHSIWFDVPCIFRGLPSGIGKTKPDMIWLDM